MRFLRPLVIAMALAAAAPAAPLDDNAAFQAGLRALKDHLPAVAATRFGEVLAKLESDDPGRATVLLRLAEAQIRAGQPEAAFEHLENEVLAESEQARLWVARGFLAMGRFQDAADAFGTLSGSKDPELRDAAILARAHLLASLGKTAQAVPLFERLAASKQAEVAEESRLLHASVLLDGGDAGAAATILEGLTPTAAAREKRLLYLHGRLAAFDGDHERAAGLFKQLADDPTHLNLSLHHSAIIAHADALHALDRNDEAVEVLLGLLKDRPDSPLLDAVFTRVTTWASANDTLRDQLVEQLQRWSGPAAAQAFPELLATGDPVARVLAMEATGGPRSNLAAYALFHRARLLAEKNDADSVSLALQILSRLRLEYPDHSLAPISLLETARLQQAENRTPEALAALGALEHLTASPELKAEAARLAGRIRFDTGEFDEAAQAFALARTFVSKDASDLTAINQALCLLQAGNETAFGDLVTSLDSDAAKRSLQLEQALLLAYRKDKDARAALDEFLQEHGNHPRLAEARLALAEVSISTEPRDLEMARAQLDSVDTAQLTDEIALRHLLTRFKLAELTGEWQDAIADANRYLQSRDTPEDAGVLLKLGEAYFLNGDYNQARIYFLRIARKEEEGRLHDVAAFFAAKSALMVGTPEAVAEAMEFLEKVAKGGGILASQARLQLSRASLDAGQAEQAYEQLAPLLADDSAGASQLDALLLAAEAQRARGSHEHLEEALDIYDRLLARDDLRPPDSNRIHFLKGLALEQLGRPDAAFSTYYSVIDRDPQSLPGGQAATEWKWFYDCGFKCLRLLEEDNRMRAAYAVARKLAATKGPRAEEAGQRARKIQLKHMFWEDE